jgi:hypothetical protein
MLEPLPYAYQKQLAVMSFLPSMQRQNYLLQLVFGACWDPGSELPAAAFANV